MRSRSARRGLGGLVIAAIAVVIALAPRPLRAQEPGASAPVETPAARRCEYCAPGAEPPPSDVQRLLREINESANWRKHGPRGGTVELGTETRMRIHRAWSSGRFQSGVVHPGGSAAAPAQRAAVSPRGVTRRQTLADRSTRRERGSLGDRRRGQDRERESSRSRASAMADETGRGSTGLSSFGSRFGEGATDFGSGRRRSGSRSSSLR
jgi:hypothetical protein